MAQAIGSKPPSVKTSLRAFWLARATIATFSLRRLIRRLTQPSLWVLRSAARLTARSPWISSVRRYMSSRLLIPSDAVQDVMSGGRATPEGRSHRKGAGPPQKVPGPLRDAPFLRAMEGYIAETAVAGWDAIAIVRSGVVRFRCDSAPGRRQGTGIPEKARRWLLRSAIMGSSGFAGY